MAKDEQVSAAPEKCNHQQCVICLRRVCWKDMPNRLEKFGDLLACPRCVRKAVEWAYTSAMTWGGEYKDVCGQKGVPDEQ